MGKGTQAQRLCERFSAGHLSSGGVLRAQIARDTPLGRAVKATIEAGKLVSDDDLFASLDAELRSLSQSGKDFLLLDGVPRNLSQVPRLDLILSGLGLRVDKVIFLFAEVQDLVTRLSARWSCGACGAVYSFDVAPTKEFVCELCKSEGSVTQRADDAPEAVRHRFEVFLRDTAPLIEVYKSRGLVDLISGLRSADEVFDELVTKFS